MRSCTSQPNGRSPAGSPRELSPSAQYILGVVRPKSESGTKPVKSIYRPISVRERSKQSFNGDDLTKTVVLRKHNRLRPHNSRENPATVWVQRQILRRPPSGPLFPYVGMIASPDYFPHRSFVRNHSEDFRTATKSPRKRYYGPSRIANDYITWSSPKDVFFHVHLSVPVTSCESTCLLFLLTFLSLGYLNMLMYFASEVKHKPRRLGLRNKLKRVKSFLRPHILKDSTNFALQTVATSSSGFAPLIVTLASDSGYRGDEDDSDTELFERPRTFRQSQLIGCSRGENLWSQTRESDSQTSEVWGDLKLNFWTQGGNFKPCGSNFSSLDEIWAQGFYKTITSNEGAPAKIKGYKKILSTQPETHQLLFDKLRQSVMALDDSELWLSSKSYLKCANHPRLYLNWNVSSAAPPQNQERSTSYHRRKYTSRMCLRYIQRVPPDEVYFADSESGSIKTVPKCLDMSVSVLATENLYESETTLVNQQEEWNITREFMAAQTLNTLPDTSVGFPEVSDLSGVISFVAPNDQPKPKHNFTSPSTTASHNSEDFEYWDYSSSKVSPFFSSPLSVGGDSNNENSAKDLGFCLRPFKITSLLGGSISAAASPSARYQEQTDNQEQVSKFIEILDSSPAEDRHSPLEPQSGDLSGVSSGLTYTDKRAEGTLSSLFFKGRSRDNTPKNSSSRRKAKLISFFNRNKKADKRRDTRPNSATCKSEKFERQNEPVSNNDTPNSLQQERKRQKIVRKEIKEYFKQDNLSFIDEPIDPLFYKAHSAT